MNNSSAIQTVTAQSMLSWTRGLDTTDFQKFQSTYFSDPAGFVEDCFPWTRSLHPTTYQLEVLSLLPAQHRVSVRGPHGLGKCCDFHDTIRLSDGSLIKAGDLINKSFSVLSISPSLSVSISTAFASDNGKKDILEITTSHGRVIRRTLNHPLWGDIDPRRFSKPEYSLRLRPEGSWVSAQDLRPGSVLAVYMGCHENDFAITDSEIIFIANMIGDGYMNHCISFCQLDGPVFSEMKTVCKTLGMSLSGSSKNRKITGVDESGKSIARKLLESHDMLGRKSADQKFPDAIWKLSKRQLSLFISRLYGCEGWATTTPRPSNKTNREIGFTSISKQLAADVQTALLRLGVQASIVKRKTICTNAANGPKRGVAWTVSIHDSQNIIAFIQNIGIFGKEEDCQTLLSNCLSASQKEVHKWQSHNLPPNMRWERVRSVKIIPLRDTVSISVPGDNTFLTDFVEHNTALASWAIIWFALTRDGHPDYTDWKVPTTASAWRQLTKYLWPEVHKWIRKVKWDRIGREMPRTPAELQGLSLKLKTGEAFAVASDDSNTIEGAHADQLLYVFDESKIIPPKTWDSAEGAMVGENAYWLSISTPGEPLGRFYDIQSRKKGYSDWFARHVTLQEAMDASRISPEWAANRLEQWGEESAMYQNRVLGEFAASSEENVIPLNWVEAAQNRWDEESHSYIVQIGCDVARQGSDETVIALRSGYYIHELIRESKTDTAQLSGTLKNLMRRHPTAELVIDVVGLGSGVFDSVSEEYPDRVFPYHAQAKTDFLDISELWQFQDTYSAMWYNLRDLLNPVNNIPIALPPDDDLISDLISPKWRVMQTGRIAVESKDKIKERLKRSPDRGEAVAMAFWTAESGGMEAG